MQMDNNQRSDFGECMNMYCKFTFTRIYPAQFGTQTLQFCESCIDLYRIRNCCYFCAQIYADDNQSFLDGKEWIQCDNQRCGKWIHLECEAKDGICSIETQIQNKRYRYYCPWCRMDMELPQKKIRRKIDRKLAKKVNNHEIPDIEPNNNIRSISQSVEKAHLDSSQTFPNDNNNHSFRYEPLIPKPSYFDELLKKYGGYQQGLTVEDTQTDIERLRQLVQ